MQKVQPLNNSNNDKTFLAEAYSCMQAEFESVKEDWNDLVVQIKIFQGMYDLVVKELFYDWKKCISLMINSIIQFQFMS